MSDGSRGLGQLVREHWREAAFWQWLWRERVPVTAKVASVALLCAAIAIAGVMAATGLGNGVRTTQAVVLATTYRGVTTVQEHGKVVTRVVPVVRSVTLPVRTVKQLRTITVPAGTVQALRTVTLPGQGRVVTNRVVRYVSVTVNGTPKTVQEVRYRTRTSFQVRTTTVPRTVVNLQTVTNQQTVVQQSPPDIRTQTLMQTLTIPRRTVTEPLIRTQTVPSPPRTVTQIVTVSKTVPGPSQTITQTQTRTITGPATTITKTVTVTSTRTVTSP